MTWWNWINEQISDATYAVKKSAAWMVVKTEKYILQSSVVDASADFLSQSWSGFTRVFNPHTAVAVFRSQQTRKILKHSAYRNLIFYMGLSLLYEGGVKPLLRMIPNMEDSYPEYSMDLMVRMNLLFVSAYQVVDNVLLGIVLTKVVTEEHPPNEHFQPCACPQNAVLQAGFASSFYYLSNLAAIKVVSSLLPMGDTIVFPLRALAYGQAITEYKLNSVGMCTLHRYEVLNKNNAFVFGFGLSYLGLQSAVEYFLRTTLGAQSYFINDALASLLFHYFTASSLLMEKPLPGKYSGKDVFYYNRLAMQYLLDQGTNELKQQLKNPSIAIPWLDFSANLKDGEHLDERLIIFIKDKFLHSTGNRLIAFIRDQFLYGTTMTIFFDSYYENVSTLNNIIYAKSIPGATRVSKAISLIPRILPDNWHAALDILKLIFDEKLNDPLKIIKAILEEIRAEQFAREVEIKLYRSLDKQSVLNDYFVVSLTKNDPINKEINSNIEIVEIENEKTPPSIAPTKSDIADAASQKGVVGLSNYIIDKDWLSEDKQDYVLIDKLVPLKRSEDNSLAHSTSSLRLKALKNAKPLAERKKENINNKIKTKQPTQVALSPQGNLPAEKSLLFFGRSPVPLIEDYFVCQKKPSV